MSAGIRFPFENTYARLPERFHARVAGPARNSAPQLIKVNVGLAEFLGLDAAALASDQGVEVLAGMRVAEGSEPLAMAYAGHQFGHFVPQLGDGRATLLGEVVARDGKRYDVQLKGSGRTAWSRGGDGKAALGPVLREYVVSEAMAAMGVPTTRALAAVVTGEQVAREEMLPGAVLTRVASSHLRVGTFQYFAARGDTEGVRVLADYAIARHYSEEAAGAANAYEALLRGVVGRHARLVARWMLLGFVHGVMNTDNTSISGETLDYGPCAFLEGYDPDTVFSSIDHGGRYRYSNQPGVAVWNLMRLAECLLPLLDADADRAMELAKAALEGFGPEYERARAEGLAAKVGVADGAALGEEFLGLMAAGGVDFTLAWRGLTDAAAGNDTGVRELFRNAAFETWMERWRAGLDAGSAERMRGANPVYIPRNHLVQAVIEAGVERGDFGPFEELLQVVTQPFEERAGWDKYARPAREDELVRATFCGT